MKVALVVMPFAAITRPSLSVGLLQANLHRAGIDCESIYPNLILGEMLGSGLYRRFSSEPAIAALAGEWVFSQLFFGERFSNWASYCRDVLEDRIWGTSRERQEEVLELLRRAPAFLERAFASRDWRAYDVIGFTSTFEQTMPSLCLARMIRERHPSAWLAIGGANCEAGMGRAYLEHFGFLDFVCTGEADTAFVRLCRSIADHRDGAAPFVSVPRPFLFRADERLRAEPEAPRPVDLEALPTPVYDDFFRAVREGGHADAGEASRHWLPVEASRGCWWGEKVHCTFCGLNGDTMRFRAKSARRVVEEADELAARFGPTGLQYADNILALGYFEDLLPIWAGRGGGPPAKFFEIKSSLTRRQVELLRRAGVTTVQAGVESLDDQTLRVMGKGVSAAQNIALLRWCLELGVVPLWNLIYGFPAERLSSYDSMADLVRRVVHLPPPDAVAPIRMDRFSPNFTRWREQGFTRVSPMPAYRHVFPFDAATLESVAYYFSYDHPQFAEVLRRGPALSAVIAEWQERFRRGEAGRLEVQRHGDRFQAIDTRFTSDGGSWWLEPHELELLAACDRPVSRRTAIAAAARVTAYADADLDGALSGMLERGLILRAGDLHVSLACLPASVREYLGGQAAGVAVDVGHGQTVM